MQFAYLKIGTLFRCKDNFLYKKLSNGFANPASYFDNAICLSLGIKCYIPICTTVELLEDLEEDDHK